MLIASQKAPERPCGVQSTRGADTVRMEFTTRISHALRTPLNAIKGAIYYLQQTDKVNRIAQKEFHSIISHETDNLVSIVESLLDFLRLEDEMKEMKWQAVNLSEWIKEMGDSKLLKSMLGGKNLDMKLDIQQGLTYVSVYSLRVVQLIISLIEGASSYLVNGDRIRVSISEEGDSLRCSVVFPREMPQALIAFFSRTGDITCTNIPEGAAKIYSAMRISEMHQWKTYAENRERTFSFHVIIPKEGSGVRALGEYESKASIKVSEGQSVKAKE